MSRLLAGIGAPYTGREGMPWAVRTVPQIGRGLCYRIGLDVCYVIDVKKKKVRF